MRALLLAIGFALMPAVAFAQAALPPKGCQAFLTVHMKECNVSLFWRCDAAPEGTVWESSFDADGAYSVHTYDRDYQWLDSYYFADNTHERLFEPGPDPISLTALLTTGVDTYDFKTREVTQYADRVLQHTGKDVDAGQTVEIDGVPLRLVYVKSTTVDAEGELVFETEGFQYVLESERLFFLGPDLNSDGQEEWEGTDEPVEFIFPGEKGFAQTTPKYGCGDVLSSWSGEP